MNAPELHRAQSWSPDAIEDRLAVPSVRQLTMMRSTFDARLDALERALDDPGQSAALPSLVLALAGAAGDEAEAAMQQACLDVRREADLIVGDLQRAVDALRVELDRERLAHAQARAAALQAEQRTSDLETRAVDHEAVRVQLEQARHEADVKAATVVEDAARARAEQDAAHARVVAEKDEVHARLVAERDAAHARTLADRDATHARALADRDATHARALVERDATHAHEVAVLEQRLTTLESDAQARVSREEQSRRRLEEQYRDLEAQLAVASRDRDRLAAEAAQLRLEIEVKRKLAGPGGALPGGTAVAPPSAAATPPPTAATAPPPTAARTPPTERAIAGDETSSSVFSSVADALRAWSAEADVSPRASGADSATSTGPSRSRRHDAHAAPTPPPPSPVTLSRPVRVRIGRDDMQMVEMTRGGGEVVTPVGLEPGRQVKLVFFPAPHRVTVTAHVSWCRLEPPSAGDGMLHYRAGLSFDLDPETFDRLSRS